MSASKRSLASAIAYMYTVQTLPPPPPPFRTDHLNFYYESKRSKPLIIHQSNDKNIACTVYAIHTHFDYDVFIVYDRRLT